MSQIWRQNGTNAREWQENSHKVFKSLLKQSEIYKIEELAYKSDNEDEEKPRTAEHQLPPALQCMLCKGLINNAMLTPCCTSSACYGCLKSYLTADHKLASSRAGMCPFPDCKEQDVYVQDLIYNHALSKAADWFRRQQIAKAQLVDVEIDKDQNLDRDLGSAARQMIE